jgi:hypothetical protein
MKINKGNCIKTRGEGREMKEESGGVCDRKGEVAKWKLLKKYVAGCDACGAAARGHRVHGGGGGEGVGKIYILAENNWIFCAQ